MIDRQQVIDALQYLISDDCTDTQFDYADEIAAAITMLSDDGVPHLLTVDEIRSGDRPIWLEERWSDGQIHGEWLAPYSREDEYGYVICGQRCLYLKHMGIYWRMWSDKPAQEKSDAESWLAEKEN